MGRPHVHCSYLWVIDWVIVLAQTFPTNVLILQRQAKKPSDSDPDSEAEPGPDSRVTSQLKC